MSFLMKFVFAAPPSAYLKAMSAISLGGIALFGVSEVLGKHLPYSKFFTNKGNNKGKGKEEAKLSSKVGMICSYAPAFMAATASFALPISYSSTRSLLLSSALTLHFTKRLFEVLFVHKYSGGMTPFSAIVISSGYLSLTVNVIYAQYLTKGSSEPQFDLKHVGIPLFLVGIAGNFYHHYLLSKLREKGEKEYKIPRGGLFSLVICPHYLFEILEWAGLCCISQTEYSFSFTLGSMGYLIGRSYSTRKWYQSNFPNFPKEVKAIIPYVF